MSEIRAVWKFPVPIQDEFTLSLPKEAEILCFDVQNETTTLWALVRPNAEVETRRFRIFGTGHSITPMDLEEIRYIDTCQMKGGNLVWHLFEVVSVLKL